ncbi:MAG: MerR family transcriptional regulator [Chloroflexia bacterium]|nr:MerR family transcriptional regulator [Chloroflexia bacterium]
MPEPRSPRPHNLTRDRSVPDTAYTLDELCALTGVTVRTVRYYIGEGLLPPPTGHGATARYTHDHLDRLLVIGAMKERYLPLREIRRSLDAMSARDISETAGLIRQQTETTDGDTAEQSDDAIASSPMLQAPPPEPERRLGAKLMMEPPSSAADYIADVLDRDHRQGRPRQGRAIRIRPPTPEPDAIAWRRVPITAGAELLIEEETYTRRREQIESLVAWAKRILTGT